MGPRQGGGGHRGPTVSPFDHVLVDHGGDDGQRDHVPGPRQHLRQLLILWERAGGSRGMPGSAHRGVAAPYGSPGRIPGTPGQVRHRRLRAAPTFMPMTFWPFTSQMQWWVRRPLRAAELSLASDTIFPFLTTMPMWPLLSLCKVTVRWKGLRGERGQHRHWRRHRLPARPPAHLSRTTMTIFSGDAFFSARCALSLLQPVQFLPSICRIWSPKRSPTSAAGELTFTSCTKMPWGHGGSDGTGTGQPCRAMYHAVPCHTVP